MAIATPVLERKVNETEDGSQEKTTYKATAMSAEEMHNARIRDNYARLINPENKLEDLFAASSAASTAAPVKEDAAEKEEQDIYTPYLVQNARADADIFRADSDINKRMQAVSYESDEEDNEDLCPTKTTIQYRTAGEENKLETDKNERDKRTSLLGKKEKIIIGTFIGIVVALFVLVIINSAIIANFNSDIATIQSGITTVKDVIGEGEAPEGAIDIIASLL